MSRDNAISVECVKVGIQQSKDGYFIRLALHPSDNIGPLVTSPVGARYICAFVEVNDHNEPVRRGGFKAANTGPSEYDRYVTQTGMLCKEEGFQEWMVNNGYAADASEEGAKQGLYKILRITSRTELRTPERGDARNAWDALYKNFVGSLDM